MKSMKMIEHRIKTSPAQMKKLMNGGAITLKPENFDPSSRRMIMVMPNTSRRIATAMRKGKGVRIMLKPDEDVMEDQGLEGGKISLKSVGKSFSKAGKDVGKALTSRKAINTYKEIGKEVLPIAKGIADAGIDAGSMALATYMGNPALAPVIAGTAKAGVDRGYSALSKKVGLDPNTPVPVFDSPESVQQYAMGRAEANIRQRTKGRVRDASLAALSGDFDTAQQLGTDYIIDKKLGGVEKKIARKAQQGQYSSVQDLATDYAAEKLAAAIEEPSGQDEIDALMMGRGISVRRSRGGIRIGGASAYQTSAYEQGLKNALSGGSITGMRSVGFDMRGVMPTDRPASGVIQLGSPYQRLQSPSMSPFIAASPQLANKPITSVATLSGGSFMAAGSRRGGSFMAAG